MGFGTAADVIFRFVFILIVPYFLNDPLYMGARFAFVMAVLAAISVVFVVLCVPEVSLHLSLHDGPSLILRRKGNSLRR